MVTGVALADKAGYCVGVVGLLYSRQVSVALELCWPTAVGVERGGLRWRFAGVSGIRLWEERKTRVRGNSRSVLVSVWGMLGGTYVWLGLCHLRGRRCGRGGVPAPFHVANKLASEICRTRV